MAEVPMQSGTDEPERHVAASSQPARLRDTLADIFFWLRTATWSRLDPRFDRRYGTRTGGVLQPRRLGIQSPAGRFAVRYQAIDPAVFRRAFEPLRSQIDFGRFTFVDLGCGKGRALLLAREMGFKEAIGVELSPQLADDARRNLEVAAVPDARVVCEDGARFEYPAGELVIYLYHPFRGAVFRRAVENICAQAKSETYLVYIAAVEEEALRSKPCFEIFHRASTFVIYRHVPHA